MRKLRLKKGAGPHSRSQGKFPAETGLEARCPPNSNALFTPPAGSHPWPPTTVSPLCRHCIPDRPPTPRLPSPSSGGAQGTQPRFLGLLSQTESGRQSLCWEKPYSRKRLQGIRKLEIADWLEVVGGNTVLFIFSVIVVLTFVQQKCEKKEYAIMYLKVKKFV